jgi:hypothetical protein
MYYHPLLEAEGGMGKGDESDPPEIRADATRSAETAADSGTTADGMTDRWFQQQLRHLYNDVVNEPLPREFLEILGKIPGGKPKT